MRRLTRDRDLLCALAGMAGMLAAVPGVPAGVRAALGVPLVLFLPGLAVVRVAALPWSLSRAEALLASLGAALLASLGAAMALSVCASVLLAATVGLSAASLALTLGAVTAAASALAGSRRSLPPAWRLVSAPTPRSLRSGALGWDVTRHEAGRPR